MALSFCIDLESRANGKMKTEAWLKEIAVAIITAHCQLIIECDRLFAEREARTKAQSNEQPAWT